jgi:hypothetical protein
MAEVWQRAAHSDDTISRTVSLTKLINRRATRTGHKLGVIGA